MNRKEIAVIFKAKINSPANTALINAQPPSHPPRNNKENKADISIILLYSANMKRIKKTEEYSTLYPATSSASASGKSKGVRLVSAKLATKKI